MRTLISVVVLPLIACLPHAQAETIRADVAVYGGTPGGIATAVEAARAGSKVVLLEETRHVGGMTAGGLSNTDFKTHESLGGFFREFMRRVVDHYTTTYGDDSMQVKMCAKGGYYEPKVARMIFETMLQEAGVTVVTNRQLTNTRREGKRVVEASFVESDSSQGYPLPLKDEQETLIKAGVFIDGTYEGDLIAKAGIPYHVGVEGRDVYDESMAPAEGNRHV